MLKKIIFLLSLLFCNNIIFTTQEPLTERESIIYHALNKKNPNIYGVLKTHDISAQNLHDILMKQKNVLLSKDTSLSTFLQNPSLSITDSKINGFVKNLLKEDHLSGQFLKYIIIPSLAIIGIPTLATGLAIKPSNATSTSSQKVISSGLIGIGSILSTPTILLGFAIAAGKIEEFLRNIVYDQKIEQLNELKDINHSLNKLDELYLNPKYP